MPNKGYNHTLEAKQIMSISKYNFYKSGGIHPRLGIKLSEELKKKLSKSHIGIKPTIETRKKLSYMKMGEKNSFYGKHHSDKTKEIISIKNSGKKFSEEHKQKIRESRKFQILPYKDSKPERFLQSVLSINGINYEMHKQSIFGYPDIFIKPNICIFIDGCYWHGCKIHNKKINNIAVIKKMERDKIVNDKLKLQNYKIIRIWEHEIINTPLECINKIRGELNW